MGKEIRMIYDEQGDILDVSLGVAHSVFGKMGSRL
jgi:hypothetical protein